MKYKNKYINNYEKVKDGRIFRLYTHHNENFIPFLSDF